jgi:UDP-N-acetylmuramoyl-tripeptide--D-alanyl-D-alanine ligase
LTRTGGEASPLNGRLVWRAGRSGARLLDDCYNANPGSFRAALDVALDTPGKHWLILGDMLELGPSSQAEHTSAGRLAAERGCSRVWAVGQWAEAVISAARDAGLDDVAAFADAESCAQVAGEVVAEGQVILVKGSRGVHLERVVDALIAEEGD